MARGLRRHGMAVDVALDGLAGFEKAVLNDYDVVVLDRNLPGMHGDEVCRRLAASDSTARILMLTAARGCAISSPDSIWAPTTTSASPSPSTNSSPACALWRGAPVPCAHRRYGAVTWNSTRLRARSTVATGDSS